MMRSSSTQGENREVDTYHFLGRHAREATGIGGFSTLFRGRLDLLLRAVSEVAGVAVAGHGACGFWFVG